jgi:hypothetical protein
MSDILAAMLKKKFHTARHFYCKFRGVADIYVKIWWWHSMLILFVWSVHKFGSSEYLSGETWRFNAVFTTAPHWPLPHQANQIHTLPHYCFKIHFTLIPSIPWSNIWSINLRFSFLNTVCSISPSHACYMSHSSCPTWFEHPTNNRILWSRNIMQLQAPHYTFSSILSVSPCSGLHILLSSTY